MCYVPCVIAQGSASRASPTSHPGIRTPPRCLCGSAKRSNHAELFPSILTDHSHWFRAQIEINEVVKPIHRQQRHVRASPSDNRVLIKPGLWQLSGQEKNEVIIRIRSWRAAYASIVINHCRLNTLVVHQAICRRKPQHTERVAEANARQVGQVGASEFGTAPATGT